MNEARRTRRQAAATRDGAARVLLVAVLALGSLVVSGAARAQPAIVDGGLVFCAVDSDCGNPYLACVPTTFSLCRDAHADASIYAPYPVFADAAICPAESQDVLDVCVPRYQLPCHADSDCGPAGFTCDLDAGSQCPSASCSAFLQCQPQNTPCTTDGDCPNGWSCEPAAGGGLPVGVDTPQVCYPPFGMFEGSAVGSLPPGDIGDTGMPGATPGVAADAASGIGPKSGDSERAGCSLASGDARGNEAWFVAAVCAFVAASRMHCRRQRRLARSTT